MRSVGISSIFRRVQSSADRGVTGDRTETFRRLELIPKRAEKRPLQARKGPFEHELLPPREQRQPVDQVWSDVWPTAQSFRASVVPLPIRMGYQKRISKKPPPDKHANLELIKIPNFLHLTPPAIKKHCDAIRRFCTPWPVQLASDTDCAKHFPLELEYSDYVHSGSSIRDPRYRTVTLRVSLDAFPLTAHAKDKLIKLLQRRYDKKTNALTLTTDSCPARHQNRDYAIYLLTVLLHESQKYEPWEADFAEEDLLQRYWERGNSTPALLRIIEKSKPADGASSLEEAKQEPAVRRYIQAWEAYRNDEEETSERIEAYGTAVRDLLQLPKPT